MTGAPTANVDVLPLHEQNSNSFAHKLVVSTLAEQRALVNER
jgi:hypothetical protein